MSATTDPNDPNLSKVGPDGQQAAYLVLSDEERAKGFIRPVRRSYVHERCGTVTTMGLAIAETYARDPHFYGGTFCVHCGTHFPIGEAGEFTWYEMDGREGSKGSSGEVRSQLHRGMDQNYFPNDTAELINEYEDLASKISGFMKYLNQSQIRGQKFKDRQ